MNGHADSEWRTRKRRIDPKLDARGWRLPTDRAAPPRQPSRTEEEETADGPADYALWLDGHMVAVVEAKKLTIGPQNALTQAERYARGLTRTPYNFHGLGVPFLYATNGEAGGPCSRRRQRPRPVVGGGSRWRGDPPQPATDTPWRGARPVGSVRPAAAGR